MPWRSSAIGISSKGMLFRLATSRSASFSISSETWTPSRVARCTWISCSTRRSSTCCRMTSAGGACPPWSRSRSEMSADCVSSWLCSTMPSLTMATTRSSATPLEDSSRVCGWAAPAIRNMHRKPVRIRLIFRLGQGGVAAEAGEYPRMALSRKVLLRVPTDDRPVSSTCRRMELSLSPVRFDT